MATTTEQPPKASFNVGMLIYDTRYRSLTIQVIFFILLMMGMAWFVNNAIANLSALGKTFNFSFLGNRAGYDINQQLIPYTADMTHARAALVGLLNTLLLAVLGCITATVIGVLAGILRLSGNWVVSRLMAVYVEGFRNVPLLLWIMVIYAIMTESMPQISDFRGEDPKASMIFGAIAVTNRGVFIPGPLFDHSLGGFSLWAIPFSWNVLAVIGVLVASLLVHRALIAAAARTQAATGMRPATWWKSVLIVVVPLALLLWALGFHWDYPAVKGFNFAGGINLRSSLIAMWLALSLYTGAFIAETVRAGILAVSRGQSEAAFALGLRPARTMRLIVLPQALRVIIPPLISQYLNLTKNSSLALAVGYMDLRSTLGGITLNQTGRELEAMMLMMLVYLCVSLIISGVMNVYNNRVRLKER